MVNMGWLAVSTHSVPTLATLGMLVASVCAHAHNIVQPSKTAALQLHGGNRGPAPTKFPVITNLLRRANTETCGYYNGDAARPETCDNGYACYTDQALNQWNCCPTDEPNCEIATACIDYNSSRKGWCSNLGKSTTCCDKNYPYCAVIPFADKTSVSFIGCKDGLSFLTIFASPTTSSTTSLTTSSTTSTTTTSSISSTSDPPTPTPTQAPNDSPPVGAIIGGALGGVAIISLAAAIIVWLLVKSRQQKNVDNHGESPTRCSPLLPQELSSLPPHSPPLADYRDHHPGHQSFGSWSGITAASPGRASNVGSPSGKYKVLPTEAAEMSGNDQFDLQAPPHYQPGLYASELSGGVKERPGHG